MTQKSQLEVIDTFSDTLALLAPPDARAELKARLSAATGDLLESVNSISTNNTAHELLGMLVKFGVLRADQVADHLRIDELDARTDRRVDDVAVEDERRQVNE